MKALLFVLAAVAAAAFASEQHEMFRRAVERSQANGGTTWVVLVAGSSGWKNYRHQSSVYKSYQLAHQCGVPDEHIITFFQDDIAYAEENPFPGQVFNELYDQKGGNNINVYAGVVKDYIAENATVANLVAVLSGDETKSGSGKTLRSTANDNVFVFYDDHGGPGNICMPGEEHFTDHDLAACLSAMQKKKMFNKLIFFMSACYSGSMWYRQTLPANVYVATSAPISSPAFACLLDPVLKTYVSSCWPHGWIESVVTHGVKVDFATVFEDAYDYAGKKSSTLPCQYGDLSLKNETFVGFLKNTGLKFSEKSKMMVDSDESAVPQSHVPYVLAKLNYEREPSEKNLREYKAESAVRLRIDDMVSEIVQKSMPGNRFLATSVCRTCDDSCECYAECMKDGTVDHCTRLCCDRASCNPYSEEEENGAEEVSCALTLQRAFSDSLRARFNNHPYILSAGTQFSRLCRSGVDVQHALEAIEAICK